MRKPILLNNTLWRSLAASEILQLYRALNGVSFEYRSWSGQMRANRRKLDLLRSGKLKEEDIVRTTRCLAMVIGVSVSKLQCESMVCIEVYWNRLLKQQKISEIFVFCLQIVLLVCNARTRENTEGILHQYSIQNCASSTCKMRRSLVVAGELLIKEKKWEI